MSFQWLKMRITEEQERRQREEMIRERLPRALDEIQTALGECLDSYTTAFGAESAVLERDDNGIGIVVRDEEEEGGWKERTRIAIVLVRAIPGFRVEAGTAEPVMIEVGLLPGDRLFYRDVTKDQYISMEQVTHRILDRVLFPKLKE